LREVRYGILEAACCTACCQRFYEPIRERAIGTEVSKSLSPGQVFPENVKQELENVMGQATWLNLRVLAQLLFYWQVCKAAGKNLPPALSLLST